MDLTEVEFMNDDLEPREINEKIKELRDALIDNVTSYTSGLPMKNFYDGNSFLHSYFLFCLDYISIQTTRSAPG